MFYPYITISAAQAHEIHNLRHACRHFLSLFLLFQALQRILGHVRPWRIVAVHPPKRGKCVGCIWRSLRIGNFVRHCDVIGLQMLLWRMQTLNWGTESIIESGSQKIFSSMKPLGPVLERTCVQITGLSNPSDPAAYQHFYSADPHWRITAAKSNSTKIYSHRFSPFAFHPNIRAQRFTFLIQTWPFQPRLKKLFQFCFTQISVESEPTLSHSRLKIILHALLFFLIRLFESSLSCTTSHSLTASSIQQQDPNYTCRTFCFMYTKQATVINILPVN